ncbi:DUF4350 domain-containing protein [Actinophytocola sp.]|uniref:DUF4350 domain-containing protein n=1 Tax=Actinophytocola sp. TaxID=1872138 RepID=UPI002ED15311
MTTSVSPDARRVWRTVRAPAAIVLMIIGVSVVIAMMRGGGDGGRLDPDSFAPEGGRALARLLAAEGVRVDLVRTAADAERAAPGATVLVTNPDWVPPQRLDTLAGDLVLIAPGQDTVDAVVPGTRVVGDAEITDRAPSCALENAVTAGEATTGGVRYRSDAMSCYAATLVQSTEDRRTVTLLGTGEPLTNARLDEVGNAALTMRLLGRHDRLVWYVPSLDDPALGPAERSLVDLVPDGVRFGLLQLAIAVVLVALWRARRLGPVVTEPLPVVVRAAETVEGRARLYRRARAADHAGEILRHAARDRLIRRLGLTRNAGPQEVVATIARRTGRPETQTHALLYGPPATGEAELVRLADALDALENEVGGS